jgi:MraZ protein
VLAARRGWRGIKSMARFVSHWTHNVDKKGRVSVPASFRSELSGAADVFLLESRRHPAMEAFGEEMIGQYAQRFSSLDILSDERDDLESHFFGRLLPLRIDGEGRIQLNDRIRECTGIGEQVLFEGRNQFFRLWHPDRYAEFLAGVERRLPELISRQQQIASGGAARANGEQGS